MKRSPTQAQGPGVLRGGALAARRGGTPGGEAARRAPAERREIGGAEDLAGPADPECVGRGAGARSRSGAKTGRPACQPEKANTMAQSTGPARVSTEGQAETAGWGRSVSEGRG